MADIDVLNPSEQSRFTLIGPGQLGQRTQQFIEEADSLEATFYSLERVDPSILKLLQQKGPLGRFIVNYGQKEASDVGPLERQIQILRDTGAEVTEFSEPTRRQRTHSKVYVSEDEFLVSTANPSVGFDQVPNINTFRPSPLRRLGALLGMDSQREIRQINYGITSRDAGLREELRSILNTVRGNEFSLSTDNFITGGRESRSADVIVSRIDQVKKGETILFGSAYMDDPRVILALARAKGRGVDVQGMVNNPDTVYEKAKGGQEELVRGGLQYLAHRGVTLYAPRRTDALKQHSKFMVLGEEGVIIGSHNFTEAADRDSAEISLSVNDRDLADQFRVSFEGVIKEYGMEKLYPSAKKEQIEEGFLSFWQAEVKANMRDMGITNPNFAYLGTGTYLDDLRAPSALPSSYFYARALYNATQYREGDLASVIRTREVFGPGSSYLGAVSSQYKVAMLLQKGDTVDSLDLPEVFRQYDLALEQGSLGDDLNELTVRLGWGRLYKADVGLLPSALGSVGRVLDSTVSYYGAEVPDYLLRVNQIDQVRIEDKPEGPFESLLTTVAENALSGMFSIFTYLISSLPAAVITSKTLGSLMQSSLDAFKRNEANFLQKFAVKGFSDLKLADIAANDSFYKTGFNFYSLQYNLMRRPGQIMFDKVIRPFIEDIISPFGSDTSEATELKEALDNFSKESGRHVTIRVEGNAYTYSSQGFDREQTLAKSFDKIGDRVPLNPFNWKTFRSSNPIPGNYLRVSDIFRLEDALAAVDRVLDPIRKLIPIPNFLNQSNVVNVLKAAKEDVGEKLEEATKKINTSQITNSIDAELDKNLRDLEHLENKLIKKGVLRRIGRFIEGSVDDVNHESYQDLEKYRTLLKGQRDRIKKAAQDLAHTSSQAADEIEASIYRRAADNRSTLNPSSLLESVKKDQYRTVGDRPPKMFLRAIGLTALLAMSIQTAASFVLDAQRSVPQITQMRTQRRLDREGLGLDTEITAAPLFQLPKELDVTSRLAYVTGAFALGFYVDSKVHRYQTDIVRVSTGKGEGLKSVLEPRIRRRRNIYGVAGGLTTIGAILLPSAVEQTLAGVRKLYRFSQRRQLRPNPVFSQGQVTASNLTLLSQELRTEDATFDEIQAAYQADKLSAMMSFMYEERTRGTSVIAIQAPTPFFQPFFTMAHRGYRDTDGGRVGGAYYFSIGIQAPPILGLGTNLELPFGVTLERDEEGIRKGSVFGLIYNPNENTFTNYFAAIAQVYTFTTVVGGVSRGIAALTSTATNLDARLASVNEALISTRILNNAIRFPLYTYRLADAIGEIGGHLSENVPEMGKSLLKDLKVDRLVPRSLKGRGRGKTLAYAAIGGALGYLLAGEGYLSINEEEVLSELHYDAIGGVAGLAGGLYMGLRSKASTPAPKTSTPAPEPAPLKSTGRAKGALVVGVTAAVTTLVITDPDFEFMRPLEEEPGERFLHRAGIGAAMGFLVYQIPYKAMVETSDTRLEERLKEVNTKLASPSSNLGSPLERLKRASLLQEKNHLDSVMQVGRNKRGIGVRYTEELFRRSAPLIFAAGVITILDRYHDRFLEAVPVIGAILQDTFDILRGGRRNEVEPLLRRGLSSAVLVNRDGRVEPVVSSDPRFFRQANRQPILRAIAQAYYADSPNPFMPLPLTSFGLTFRSRADGMIATPYLQFQAASVDISFSETIMSTMSQSAQRSVLSGGYDVTFETMQIHQMQDKGQKVHHLLNLTASVPPLAKRRSISRPSEMVMSYISKDPLLSYLMQDRARRSASDSYKRPESLYFGIEAEAWQTIRSNVSPATLNKLTPQDIEKLIYDIINPRGMKQSFNLVPEAQGLGRLRFNSNRDIEDLLILSSPFYEDEVRPMENRLQNFISSALAGVEGAFSFSPILGWAAVGVFGLFSMLAISGMTRTYNYIDSQRLNSKYEDLQERLINISKRRYTPVTDPTLADAPRFGRKNLVKYEKDSNLLITIQERAEKVKANQKEFIEQVLGTSSLKTSSHKTLSQMLQDLSSSNATFSPDELNRQITIWLEDRIEELFKFSDGAIITNLGGDFSLTSAHEKVLKEQFSAAVKKVVSKQISYEFYKVGGIFYHGKLYESTEIIARAISLKFLELVEEPLRQFYDDLAGLLSGVADVSDIETLESIARASSSPAIQASSTTSAPRVKGAEEKSSLYKIHQALYRKSNWAKSLEAMGAILGGALSVVSVIEALGIANLGLRISAAYSEDSPTGYINNLVESWSRDFLITNLYAAGGLFNKPITFMIGAASLTVLDMVLSRYEPYREFSRKVKDNSLHYTSQAYKATVENLSVGFVEEEDVAFGITAVGTIGAIAGAAGTAKSFMGIKNIPDWIVHPFQEVGKGTFKTAARMFRWASRNFKWGPLLKLTSKVGRSGKGKMAAVTGLAALGLLVVGGLAVLGAAVTRSIYGGVTGSSIYREASRVTQAVTNSVEDRIPFIRMFMPHPMDYLNGYRANSSQNPFLVASPDDAIKMEYLQMLSSAGQDFGGGSVSYFVSSEVYGIPNRYSRESKIISQAFEGMGPHRLLDPLLDRMLMMRGQEFDNRVIGQMNWRALIRRAANHRELKKALDNTRESARARRTNTNSTARRLSEDYNIVLYAAALLKPSNPSPETEAVKISFAEVPRNTNYDQAALAVEAATGRGQAGSRDVKVRDLGPGNGFEVDITPSQSHLVELAATQYRARQNTMQPTA